MDQLLDNFGKLGRYIVAVLLIWLGAVGLMDVGFTTVDTFPFLEFDFVAEIVFALQIIIGLGIFNSSVKRFSKPIALAYFLLVAYGVYINYGLMFSPALPYLTDFGRNIFLETFLIFSGYSYLRHLK